MLDLGIVIVNYNVCALLRRCLDTVFDSEGDFSYKVCVVDNNSGDDSVGMVREQFPDVHLIANDENLGYPAANNQGLRALGVQSATPPRYALLLNPDTELPADGLARLLCYMDQNADVGVVGPRLVLPDGSLDLACRRGFDSMSALVYRMVGLSRLFPRSRRFARYNMTYLDERELSDVDSVVGAFMLVRTKALKGVGLLDDRFWMYGEDLDWAKRIKSEGWRVVYNPEVTVLHIKRASSRQNPRAQTEFYRAMLIFYYKHYRATTTFWLHWLVLFGIALKGGRAVWPDVLAGPEILNRPRFGAQAV
ncbi:MAG TPA: glycosyltransferase family 2 protein [Candidatus Sulfomarinibacteraceae bacterium]|nr:glycosyltransferase family 2 protein [Candidatus Sulfomarinibacteraceae bacterium]